MTPKTFFQKYKYPIILFILNCCFFYKLFLRPTEMIFPATDITDMYSFWKWFLVNSVKTYHALPLWNPYMFGGASFIGSGQSAMFYPFNIIYLLFPPDLVFGYMFFLDMCIAGITTYFYARVIKLHAFSAFICGLIFMLSGPLVLRIYPGHIFIMDSIVWFPSLLLLFELSLQRPKLLYAPLMGIIIALMILAGNIQILIYSLVAVAIYCTVRLLPQVVKKRITKKYFISLFIVFSIGSCIGVLLSAVQLLPSLELSALSVRSEGLLYAFASDFSLHPKQLISFLLPHAFGSPLYLNSYWGKGNFVELCGYMSVTALILSSIGIFLYKKNQFVVIFIILGLFSLLFALGPNTPVFQFFYDYIPSFQLFRAPARILFIYSFSIAICSGFGIEVFNEKIIQKRVNILHITIFLIISTVLLIPLAFFFNTQQDAFITAVRTHGYAFHNDLKKVHELIFKDLLSFIIFACLCLLSILLRVKNKINTSVFKIIFSLIIFVDLWMFGTKFYNTKKPQNVFAIRKENLHVVNELDFLEKNKGLHRIFDMSGETVSFTGKKNIQSAMGYDAVYLKEYQTFLWESGPHLDSPNESFMIFYDIKNVEILKLLNIKYIISRKQLTSRSIKETYKDNFFVYELQNHFPRAYIVPNALQLTSQQEVLSAIKKNTVDLKRFVLISEKITSAKKNNGSFQQAPITSYKPDEIIIQTTLDNPGYLILSEMWFPGWKAFDNEKEVPILKANYLFRGIYLTKGNHNIRFIYDPISYKIGFVTSLVTLLFCIWLITIGIRKNR